MHAQDGGQAPSPFECDALTGDWSGQRSALIERGVGFGLAVYQDVLSVVELGLDATTYAPGLVEPAVMLDLGQLFGWAGTRVLLRGLGMYGRDPVEGTGSLDAPSNLANAVQTFRLFEAWIERPFVDDTLSVRAGLYAVDAEFDVKATAGIFVNGGFGTGVDLSQSGQNGPCVYPTSCLGVRVKYEPAPYYYLQVAVLDGVAGDPDDPRGTHMTVDLHDEGVFTIGEVGYQRGAGEGGFLRAALGVWYYSAPFEAAARRAGTPVEDAEVALELTHYVQVLPWLSLQFDAQYFIHPGTDPAVDDALLFGLRTGILF